MRVRQQTWGRSKPALTVSLEPPGTSRIDSDAVFLFRKRLETQYRCRSRRFLNFHDCCKWVQMNHDFKTQEEWEEWLMMGEGLSPYVPTRPDEVYSRTGHWRGWQFFLQGIVDADDDPRWGEGEGPIITR